MAKRPRGRPRKATAQRRARKAAATSRIRAAPLNEERLKALEPFVIHQSSPEVVNARMLKDWKVGPEVVAADVAELERRWAARGQTREELAALSLYRGAAAKNKVGQALAAMKAAREEKRRAGMPEEIARFEELGPPPVNDPIALAAWAQRNIAVLMHLDTTDPTLDGATRRAAAIKYARVIAALMPMGEMHDANERVKRQLAGKRDDDEDPEDSPVDGKTQPLRPSES